MGCWMGRCVDLLQRSDACVDVLQHQFGNQGESRLENVGRRYLSLMVLVQTFAAYLTDK
jgi:hypothetical protein